MKNIPEKRKKHEKNTFDLNEPELSKKERRRSFFERIMVTGFTGGILWSFMGWIASAFHFAEIGPTLILQPFISAGWKDGYQGILLSIFLIGIISIFTALLYYVFFKRVKSMWGGVGYGIVLWILVFYAFAAFFPVIKGAAEFTQDTIVTTLCLYILYGVFIGYSISFEENELGTKQAAKSSNQ
ncbi:YqhR family membrane protein [Metabacillus sp. RGM 3146]|uniref:YqhR family membrane protein n=1 Tax=Metabacillus sp. RGM 3146 TaxID=3401092 RepID=UPI003B9C0793